MLAYTVVGQLSRMDALGRMDQGTYGRCLECGSLIPYDRLIVMPETGTCARCGRG